MYVAYERISKDPYNTSLAIERQHEDNEKLAAELGWTPLVHFQDRNRSAYKKDGKRPQYREVMQLIEDRQVEGLIIYDISRLLRRVDELEKLIATVEEFDLPIKSASGIIDLSTPNGRGNARHDATYAQQESEVKAERVRRSWVGAPRRTFGYSYYPENADIVKWMVHNVMNDASLPQICNWLNEDGNLTVKGAIWRPTALKMVLLHKDTADVIGLDGWIALKEYLESRTRARVNPSRRGDHIYFLSGFVRCAQCGATMIGRSRTAPGRPDYKPTYYCQPGRKCGGCGISIQAKPLEDLVTLRIRNRIAEGSLVEMAIDTTDDDELKAKIKKIDRAFHIDGTLDEERYFALLAELQAQQVKPMVASGFRPTLETWDSYTDDELKVKIPRVLEYVKIKSWDPTAARKFDANRVMMKARTQPGATTV